MSSLPLRSSVVQRLQRFATYGHLKQVGAVGVFVCGCCVCVHVGAVHACVGCRVAGCNARVQGQLYSLLLRVPAARASAAVTIPEHRLARCYS